MDTLIKSVDGHEEGYVIKTKNNCYFSTNELLNWCFDSDFDRADIFETIESCKEVLKVYEVDINETPIWFKRVTKDVKYREYEE